MWWTKKLKFYMDECSGQQGGFVWMHIPKQSSLFLRARLFHLLLRARTASACVRLVIFWALRNLSEARYFSVNYSCELFGELCWTVNCDELWAVSCDELGAALSEFLSIASLYSLKSSCQRILSTVLRVFFFVVYAEVYAVLSYVLSYL